jgi:hypothetical protein
MATSAEIQTRLDAYLAAELEILSAQEMSKDGKSHRLTELKEVRAQIDVLERSLARKQRSEAGNGSFAYAKANMNPWIAK